MTKSEYLQRALDAYDSGKISAEAYDLAIRNADIFCDDDEECEGCPPSHNNDEYDDIWEGEKQMSFDRKEWRNR